MSKSYYRQFVIGQSFQFSINSFLGERYHLRIQCIDWNGHKREMVIPASSVEECYTFANRIFRMMVNSNIRFQTACTWVRSFNQNRYEDTRVVRGLMECPYRIGEERERFIQWQNKQLQAEAGVAPLSVTLPPRVPAHVGLPIHVYEFLQEIDNG